MTEPSGPVAAATGPDLVWVPGGTFSMGSDDFEPEEAPAHRVTVDGFWMEPVAVTNGAFREFVSATGYVTVAERPLDPADYPGAPVENLVPGSMVFTPTAGPVDLRHLSQWWQWTPGACWDHPNGPDSAVDDLLNHPVVHVAFEDAQAYAEWVGRSLPTEAEWERAARGGVDGLAYAWGDEATPGGKRLAKFYEGDFPWRNTPRDGFEATSPVRSFPPNQYGLFEMCGNTWEWTTDWYAQRHPSPADKECCVPTNPRGGDLAGSLDPNQPQFPIGRKVIKGGSHLCADTYCRRYRPAARRPQVIDTGMSHIGFRCIVRADA